MFTLPEIEIIMNKCRPEMLELLRHLGFMALRQEWDSEIDPFITRHVCALMKSESVIEGYSFLLRAANIPSGYSETPNEKLASIISHRAEIEDAVTKRNESPKYRQYESKFYAAEVSYMDIQTLKDDSECLSKEAESIHEGLLTPRDRIEFKKKILALCKSIQSLPGSVIILPGSMMPYSESEFTDMAKKSKGQLLVSVSREEVTPKPDISAQYRKFTPDEFAEMFDVLEKIYAVVKKI